MKVACKYIVPVSGITGNDIADEYNMLRVIKQSKLKACANRVTPFVN